MKEKINEVLLKAEAEIGDYDTRNQRRRQKISFLHEHGFHKEKEWLIAEQEATNEIFFYFKNSVRELRKVLNAWNS